METPGYFQEEEAELLAESVSQLEPAANVLEIGTYLGRSTLFGLSALSESGLWVSVDSFRRAAGYQDNSLWSVTERIQDKRWRLLPMTLASAVPLLSDISFDLVFVDGDHSFLGAATDLAISVALLGEGRRLLCHDYAHIFPGVMHAVDALIGAGVLARNQYVGSLIELVVMEAPSWVNDPCVVPLAEGFVA